MVNVARESLHGQVEVDETWVGGPQAGLRGSRQLKGRKAAPVLVAVEKRGGATGRAGMAVIGDSKAATLTAFLKNKTWRQVQRCTPTVSRASPGSTKLGSNTWPGTNSSEPTAAKARSRWCHCRTVQLATSSNG